MQATRREFLGAGAVGAALVTSIQPAPAAISGDIQRNLKIIMDLMIPEGDDMPSASQAGGLIYLTGVMAREKSVSEDIHKGLAATEAYSQRQRQKPFAALAEGEQIIVLKEMEAQTGAVFDLLRAYVYESYYTQPAIWRKIGYELYPTDHTGPHMKPFDDGCLARVREMPKLYREG